MSSKILCIGSVAYDTILTPFGKAKNTLGGSAGFFSLASSLFAPTAIVAAVGDDFRHWKIFESRGIDVSGVQKARGKTFRWTGKYRFDLNTRETLKTELGVFADFQPRLNKQHRHSPYVFLGNIHPKLQSCTLRQVRRPKLIGMDTMSYWIEKTRRELLAVMKKTDLLVINDSEARELSRQHNLLKAARKILQMMGGQKSDILIIKQGEYGLLLFHHNAVFNLPGYPLEDAVDPTGAGDSFAGALMGYLAKTGSLSQANLKKACATASAVASFTVEDFGANRLRRIKISEVNQRLVKFKKLINF